MLVATPHPISNRFAPPPSAPTPPRRVLIVAPHFPPSNAPDGQRARLILPHLPALGWKAEVLAVRPEFVETPLDPGLAFSLPAGTPVHRVLALSPRATHRWGWGSLARRAYRQLRARGDELLAEGRFDLVFFSTCQFGVLPLGPYWRRRHAVPYIVDFHDEWAGDYYRHHPEVTPPGGRFKYTISHALACWQEGPVVERAAQIVAVSPRYNVNLRGRHPRLDPARLHVLPFGGAESDFQVLERHPVDHGFFTASRGVNWVYVGRGGPTMNFAARSFFLALQRAVKRGLAPAGLHLHFIGTAYAAAGRASPTFERIGGRLVREVPMREHTARVPHFTALQCLRDADALLLFGADDPGYCASKLASCLFARKPLLAILHRESPVAGLVGNAAGAVLFTEGEQAQALADRIHEEWFARQGFLHCPALSPEALAACDSAAMTRRLAQIFAAACDEKAHRP